MAQALQEMGYVSSFQEAFDRYIGRNGPAYAERVKLTPAEAIAMLAKAGTLPVLAHPASLSNLDDLLEELKAVGMVGMEVYYQDYDQKYPGPPRRGGGATRPAEAGWQRLPRHRRPAGASPRRHSSSRRSYRRLHVGGASADLRTKVAFFQRGLVSARTRGTSLSPLQTWPRESCDER